MSWRTKGILNRRAQKNLRNRLRNSTTSAEAILWTCLQQRKLLGRKFRRQFSIGPYIVDFYCPECRLAVELDGAPHFTDRGVEHDAERTAYLKNCGVQVMRFENDAIREDIEGVLELIRIAILNSK